MSHCYYPHCTEEVEEKYQYCEHHKQIVYKENKHNIGEIQGKLKERAKSMVKEVDEAIAQTLF